MLWFAPLPWGRWLLVSLLAAFALYLEFRPDATIEVPFATVDLLPGDVVDETNTELRPVPVDLLNPAQDGDRIGAAVRTGDPALASDVRENDGVVPPGWWVIGVTLPDGANVGNPVRLVLLDSGEEVEGVVAHPGSDDPFAAADGGVAVPGDASSRVAMAAAEARLAVLLSTG